MATLSGMEIVELTLLVVHIVGFAVVLGTLLLQLRADQRRVVPAMRDASLVGFVAGLALVAVVEANQKPLDVTRISVEFGLGLVLVGLIVANSRRPELPGGLYYGLIAVTVGAFSVAMLG